MQFTSCTLRGALCSGLLAGTLLLGLGACVGGASGNPAEARPMASIAGTLVTASTTGGALTATFAQGADVTPVAGATCTLEGTANSDVTDADGNFALLEVASGSYILICKLENPAGSPLVVLKIVEVAEGDSVLLGEIVASFPGAIAGTASLAGSNDSTGIVAYLPGTSFLAQSAADGTYNITGVPEGTYVLRFESQGYHTVSFSAIEVQSGEVTNLPSLLLSASTGATGVAELNDATMFPGLDLPVVGDLTVTADVTASDDATLMQISDRSDFLGEAWSPMTDVVEWTFETDGLKSLYLKFADANGLESAPIELRLYVDATAPTPVGTNCDAVGAALCLFLTGFPEANEVVEWRVDLRPYHTSQVREQQLRVRSDSIAPVTEIKLSWDDPTFSGAAYESLSDVTLELAATASYVGFASVTVPDSDGSHMLYFHLRDALGNTSEGTIVPPATVDYGSLEFVLDRQAPVAELDYTPFNVAFGNDWMITSLEVNIRMPEILAGYEGAATESVMVIFELGPTADYGTTVTGGLFMVDMTAPPDADGNYHHYATADLGASAFPLNAGYHFRLHLFDFAGNELVSADRSTLLSCAPPYGCTNGFICDDNGTAADASDDFCRP